MSGAPAGWVPPAYPYDRLEGLREVAARFEGGAVDLSIGTPTDPPPPAAVEALGDPDRAGALRGYPTSLGSAPLRRAIATWLTDTFGLAAGLVGPAAVAACVGTKEFVATTPAWMAKRDPGRDTVLYPAVSYPTYAMGAELAGLRAVPVPLDAHWRLDLTAVADSDAERALLLWSNTPGNPAGGLDDLQAVAAWGRHRGIPVFSDECYCEFTWDGPPRSVLAGGSVEGVVALHSLSKRSNLAGLRVGWYSGDPEIVGYLGEVRKHAGLMVPGPAQAAAAAALTDRAHVDEQRQRYRSRLERLAEVLRAGMGLEVGLPAGGFYLWVAAPDGDAWALSAALADRAGVIASPGEFYGPAGGGHVRLAVVAPSERIEVVARRLGV
ncbi:MAG TPA: pyridoxal phosphate-dependent aminotransferase [Acidimicrobiales bacterium]|nr:pyridoxal phosphate-dependent aminotransferase [Acidimicrobiales bacterium]